MLDGVEEAVGGGVEEENGGRTVLYSSPIRGSLYY
jgi:hypothetical protein